MTASNLLLFSLLVSGCIITQSFSEPFSLHERVKRDTEVSEAEKAAENLEKNGEDTKSYANWDKKNTEGLQKKMDDHFTKKRKEGDEITESGDKSRKENEDIQSKIDKNQYQTVAETFKLTEADMLESVKELET